MNVVLDINVIIDCYTKRYPFCITSSAAIEKLLSERHKCYISSFSISTIYYLIEQYAKSEDEAINAIKTLVQSFEIVDSDVNDVINSFESNIKDYEDALIESSAIKINADYILTRDTKDFANSKIKAIDPYHFLKLQ